ncbi:MAG TPA: hypothetical protein VNF93_00730 [Buchnera sp. (in: enterobacteria)]|nr:hypothetical protein [Buchnera sp. (in: enterobacteria)]
MWHTRNTFSNEPVVRLAKKLIFNSFVSQVLFSYSNAEVNENVF